MTLRAISLIYATLQKTKESFNYIWHITQLRSPEFIGGGGRNRTGVHGFAGRCMTTLPPRRFYWPVKLTRETKF